VATTGVRVALAIDVDHGRGCWVVVVIALELTWQGPLRVCVCSTCRGSKDINSLPTTPEKKEGVTVKEVEVKAERKKGS
jgi:hypothetical protein